MKKASAYSPTEECWLETLYSHGATASLKVDGVKYKKKKGTRSFLEICTNSVQLQQELLHVCYSCMLYYQNANEPVNYELIFLNLDRYGEPSTGTIKQNQGKSHRSAV